jgi:hypothetical protein
METLTKWFLRKQAIKQQRERELRAEIEAAGKPGDYTLSCWFESPSALASRLPDVYAPCEMVDWYSPLPMAPRYYKWEIRLQFESLSEWFEYYNRAIQFFWSRMH